MLDTAAGITHIRMLYLQLLYRCNFSCKHCFHGDLLASRDAFTPAQATAMIDHFQATYFLEAVTLLGGEPLLYPNLASVALHAKSRGLAVEICTNGHPGFRERLRQVAPYLDKFRVSLDGLGRNHDSMRQRGSFEGALQMIDFTRSLGIPTGATMTVTRRNLDDVVLLAKLLNEPGSSRTQTSLPPDRGQRYEPCRYAGARPTPLSGSARNDQRRRTWPHGALRLGPLPDAPRGYDATTSSGRPHRPHRVGPQRRADLLLQSLRPQHQLVPLG